MSKPLGVTASAMVTVPGRTVGIAKVAVICAPLFACVSTEKAATDSSSVSSAAVSTPAIATPAQPAPAPAPARSLEIYIDSVVPANPLVVSGRARTFENTVQVRARDSEGNIIAAEHVMSAGEMGRHNPYTAQLWITRDPGPRVTVEAFEYSAKDGSVRSLTSKVVPYGVERMRLVLYRPVGTDCIETRAFPRAVPKSVSMARLLVETLMAGADRAEKAAGAVSPFPQGSDVNSVVLRDGGLTVDFNERLRNVGGSCAATAIRHSVTRTLGQLPTVKRVLITAGGSEKLALQP